MEKPNFKQEALEFCKKNSIHPSMVLVDSIALAIEHGYAIAVAQATAKVKGVSDTLARRRAENFRG